MEVNSAYVYNSMRTHTCSSSIKIPSDTQMEAISEPSNLSSLFMYSVTHLSHILLYVSSYSMPDYEAPVDVLNDAALFRV